MNTKRRSFLKLIPLALLAPLGLLRCKEQGNPMPVPPAMAKEKGGVYQNVWTIEGKDPNGKIMTEEFILDCKVGDIKIAANKIAPMSCVTRIVKS